MVYSTDGNRIFKLEAIAVPSKGDSNGIMWLRHQTTGRKGREVCLISDINLDEVRLAKLAPELKKCGCDCTVKDGIIEIQGNKQELLKALLEDKDFRVKLTQVNNRLIYKAGDDTIFRL